jgi:purine-binding chemotaxis protein CheW
VLPVIDLAALLPGSGRSRRYDGSGEVLRLHAAGGSVGVWVDRVERLVEPGMDVAETIITLDPEPLVAAGMVAPSFADTASQPLGDAADLVARAAPPAAAENAYFLVETAGNSVRLPRDNVVEFIEPPPCVAVPGAPAGFLGVGILRGAALPMLSLAMLLGIEEHKPPASFAVVALDGKHRLLLGFGRVIGLRTYRQRTGRRWVDQVSGAIAGTAADDRIFDLATALPEELQHIVAGFAVADAPGAAAEAAEHDRIAAQYVSFVAGGANYALPVEAVERVAPASRLLALPQLPGNLSIEAAIELRGQIVPVARLDGVAEGQAPDAYVILRGASGLMAIGVDRVERLVALPSERISPAGDDAGIIDSVAVLDDRSDVLRILAPERIGVAA